ncbi:hypothetical protein JX265_007679 [Neoarthrinium moseri]|uniref:Ketoreductase domain-containing protein n=1 Tax=Neoarthrinium moseri TaxID=1658444 RepID=A0A9Q0AP24_9PEZI|nr:hypothetical protein JX265_007679 [Neoarthrinium moseri]
MVKCGARYILITSRNSSKNRQTIQELEAQGPKVVIKTADLTNKQQIVGIRDYILKTMPPIGGVANGAMVQVNSLFADLDYDVLQELLRSKVGGSVVLDEVFSHDDLDFFLLFSSISALTGQSTQANYAAANNFMIALAFQRRARTFPASVVDFGPIIGLGSIQRYESSGFYDITSVLRSLNYMPISERDLHYLLTEAVLVGKKNKLPEITTGVEAGSSSITFWHKSLLFPHIL